MLSTFAGSAMVAMAGPAPVIPPPEPAGCHGLRGSIGVTLGQTWLSDAGSDSIGSEEEDEFASALVELRLGYDLSSRWYAQLDILGEFTDVDHNKDDSYHRGWGSAFHLLYTLNDCHRVGVFGGWFETETDEQDNIDRAQRYIFGIEGLTEVIGFDVLWQVGGIVGRENAHDAATRL